MSDRVCVKELCVKELCVRMLCEKYMCESLVCVNHLNRCKTSMLAFALGFRFWYCITRVSIVSCQVAGGWRGHMRLHPTKLLI